jgi:hypothetical protein
VLGARAVTLNRRHFRGYLFTVLFVSALGLGFLNHLGAWPASALAVVGTYLCLLVCLRDAMHTNPALARLPLRDAMLLKPYRTAPPPRRSAESPFAVAVCESGPRPERRRRQRERRSTSVRRRRRTNSARAPGRLADDPELPAAPQRGAT